MSVRRRPVVAVVGGGVAGLAAAWELVAGADAPGGEQLPEVHVFESGDRLGGKLRSTEFAGRTIDLAADAFLARRPEAVDLCKEIGAEGELVPVGASGASILARGRLRPMPEGLALGVPTRWLTLARSGVLGPMSTLRAGVDLFAPHLGTTRLTGDRAVGDIVGERLGRGVVEQLVDPLIGGIHAGGVDDLSAAATFPLLIAASRQPGSFMRRLGRSQATASEPAPAGETAMPAMPAFWSLRGSTASLIELLAARLVDLGVTIHVGAPVGAVTRIDETDRSPGTWRLVPGGEPLAEPAGSFDADGLVLAAPAAQTAALLAVHAPAAAGLLAAVEYAAVGVVTVTVRQGSIGRHLEGTGFLVPRTTRIDDRGALITGCTYLGRKWPHLARPGDELLRMSVGRFGDLRHADLDDDELAASCFGELAQILDINGAPTDAHVQRWDRALPQYRVDHLVKVAFIEKAVADLPCVALAGSAYRGVGIPACVGSGRAAGKAVRDGLAVHDRRSEG